MEDRRRRVYEGKAKVLFEGPEPGTLVQYFKDDATAFNNQKKGTITGKGVLNNRISEYLMIKLGEIGVPTHFMKRINMREQLIRKVEIIPVEVVVRNIRRRIAGQTTGHTRRHRFAALGSRRVLLSKKDEPSATRWFPTSISPRSAGRSPHELDEIMSLLAAHQ